MVIEDRYEITISQTFQTDVPTPVLVSEPAGITMPELAPGEVFNGEYNVTNYGLIKVDNVNIQFPSSFGEYDIELLSTVPATINARQKVTIPYRITRRQQVAAGFSLREQDYYACNSAPLTPHALLLTEVQGFGGSCYNSFTVTTSGSATICPGALNEKTVTKTTIYTVTAPVPGSNCGPSTSSSSGGGGGGNPWGSSTGGYGSDGGGSQSAGSGSAGSSGVTAPITSLPNDEGCIYPKAPDRPPCGSTGGPAGSAARQCKLKDDPPSTCLDTGSSLDIANGTYLFTETDLKVPARSIPIEWSRTFRSNQIMRSADYGKWSFAAPMNGTLGFGWHSPWFAKVGDGYYLDGQGTYYTFRKDSAGNYLPHAEAGLVLRKTTTGYELQKRGEYTSIFSAEGALASLKDARGNR